jgi:hypothetical protein
MAWVVTELVLHFGKRLKRHPQRKTNKHKFKSRVASKGVLMGLNTVIFLTAAGFIFDPVSAHSQIAPIASSEGASFNLDSSNTNIWQNGVGNGFRSGVQSVGIGLGAGYGVQILGGRESHDLALASIYYGYMFGPVEGADHWYRGNWELRGELFSGAQFEPTSEWLVGLTPHLRYNFATGTRWIPYVDLGAGVSATSIGPPDLSHYFEFNLQAAVGVRWFIRDNVALGIEARYLHMSCAGMDTPNLGLNNVNGMLSVSWFF